MTTKRIVECFLLLLPFSLLADSSRWYDQPQFVNYLSAYHWNSDSLVNEVPFSAQAWGLYVPATPDDALKLEVATWHARGGVYFPFINLTYFFTSSPPPDWDSFRMRSLDGAYMNFADGSPSYSLSSQVFQSFLMAQAKRAADLGSDGLLIDDVVGPIYRMVLFPPHGAGSFDPVTMGAFRTYLQQKYSSAVLQAQFGITDIGSFNFGSYIRSNNLSNTWNQYPLKGLPLEFFLFRRQETLDFLRKLIPTVKQYAQQQYHRDFLFTGNAGFDPLSYFVRDVMDLTTNETFYIRGFDHPFMATDIRAWKGWKVPQLVLPEAFPPSVDPGAPNVTNPLTRPTVNLMRVIIADIQAAGGVPGATTRMNVGVGTPEPVDLSVVRRYANFILGNPQLVTRTSVPSRIALLECAPSVLGGRFPTPGQNNPWNGPTNYTGTARLLLDSGFTYDSVFLPDTSYSTLPSPTASVLAHYDVVIAPSVWAIDDMQANSLIAYAQQGGTLVVSGDFATNLPNGAPASHPELAPTLATIGETPYGLGRIVVSKELFGVEYQSSDRGMQRQARASFQSFLATYAQPDVRISGVTVSIHEPGITPFFYRDSAGRALVHLVNYDYDDSTDQFYSKTDVTTQVRVGAQPVDEVILRSPDFTGAQAVPFTRDGDIITVTVPRVDAWVVLLFQQNAVAPVINVATPPQDLGVVGGNSITFSVQASDGDGNPLTYTWSVNGQVVADVFGPTYTLQVPASASLVYTVAVVVTDGSRITQRRWAVNVVPHRPRVLFDESHAERNTIDPVRASQLNPQHPEWVLFNVLAQKMTPNYQVSRLTIGPITPQVLSGIDVLVLAAPDGPFSTAENQAITSFVQAGGGLIFLGDAWLSAAINALIMPWGIQFDSQAIESLQEPNCAGCFALASFANHPAVGPNPEFETNYGGSLSISQGAVAMGRSSSAEWKSVSGQPTQQPGDQNGPFVMAAAAQPGRGHVFAVSDNAFHDDYLLHGSPLNANLFLSALAWMTSALNSPPAPPSSFEPMVSSILNAASFAAVVSAGSWATIFGQNLANAPPTGQVWTANDFKGNLLPTTLAGTSIWLNGKPAAVAFASPTQLNVQVPDDTFQGTVSVQVATPYGVADATTNLRPLAPAVFVLTANNSTYAAAVGADGRLIAPPDQIPGARAAHPGEVLMLFGTGFGETLPHQPSGMLVSTVPLANPVTATLCGQPADVDYAGLVGPGVNQINITVPELPPGNCAIRLFVAGVGTQDSTLVPIGP